MMYQHVGGFGFLVWLVIAVVAVAPFWKICVKAGYSGWLSLLVLIPLANLVFLYFLAFSDWPSQRPGTTA
jgi:hypothetical protein